MSLEPPKKPLPWQQNPIISEIDQRIIWLTRYTNQSFFGNDNWRDKEASLQELESTKKEKETVIKQAKDQYKTEMKEYDELYKAYEVELTIENERLAEEAKELEKKVKKNKHPILGLDLK